MLLLAAIWLLFMLRQLALESASEKWPSADGRVRAVAHRRGGAVVDYEYEAGGKTYRGDDRAYGFEGTTTVVVSYDPNKPSRSMIVTGIRMRTLLDAAVPLLLMIFTASWLSERSSLRDADPSK